MRKLAAIFIVLALLASGIPMSAQRVILGDEQFSAYIPDIEGRKIAIFSNASGVVGDKVLSSEGPRLSDKRVFGPHLLDVLLEMDMDVTAVFTPEHGFRMDADAGEHVGSQTDPATGVRILSLYGKGTDLKSSETMRIFDVLLVDIQDVGLRYYTYYVTMFKLMDACAAFGKDVIILDRPNPNGFYVDGPILDVENYRSGVGWLPIPIVHGMTLGELALMINGEGWLEGGRQCSLKVVPCRNYKHSDKYELIMPPSPNIKSMRAVYLYSSTCFFEGTKVSLGRGTQWPFEIYGHPDMSGYGFSFTPRSIPGAKNPPCLDNECFGVDLRDKPLAEIWNEGVNLEYVIDAYSALSEEGDSFFGSGRFFDLLAGNSWVREMISKGASAEDIKARWKSDVERFKEQRRPYLLYP